MTRHVIIPYAPRWYQEPIHAALDSHRYAVLVMHRRLGKTVMMINELIRKAALCTNERPRYGYIAPLYTQAKQIAWDYLKHYTAPIPGVKRNESELFVMIPNGAQIKLFGADNPDSLRGLYFDGVVFDEVADMKPEVWAEVVRPALADRKGWAYFIGTPKGLNQFHSLYQQGLTDPAWYTSLLTVDDTDALDPGELAQAKRTMSDNQYRQEFYCDFGASSDDIYIPLSVIQPAMGAQLREDTYQHAPVVMGFDVARFGDDASIAVKRQGNASWIVGEYRNRDTSTLAGLFAQLLAEHKPDAAFIDTGYNPGVYDLLRQWGETITPVDFGSGATRKPDLYANKRAEMWGYMRQWLEEGGALPEDQELAAHLSAPMYEYTPANKLQLESKKNIKKRGLPSPDKGDALALTFAQPVQTPRTMAPHTVEQMRYRMAEQARANDYSVLDYE